MQVVNFLSALAIPATIIIIIFYGIKEKVKVFDSFLDGAKEGIQIVVELFPTLLGIFLAIGLLRTSGVLEFIISIISPITNILNIELLPNIKLAYLVAIPLLIELILFVLRFIK